MMVWIRALATALLLIPSIGFAQQGATLRVELGVDPAEVTVGQPFRTAIRVSAPPGFRVTYDEFVGTDSIEAVAPPTTMGGEPGTPTALQVYTLAAWVAEPPPSAILRVRISDSTGVERVQNVRLQLPTIVSVLPDEGEIEPRPARGLIGSPGWHFPWWLLFLLLAAWLVYRYLTRSRPVRVIDPRTWALDHLGDEGAAGLLAAGDYERAIGRVSWVVREYLARVDSHFGRDLTTTELLGRFADAESQAGLGSGRLERIRTGSSTVPRLEAGSSDPTFTEVLRDILGVADRVKFGRYRPAAHEARQALEDARWLVERYPPAHEEARSAA